MLCVLPTAFACPMIYFSLQQCEDDDDNDNDDDDDDDDDDDNVDDEDDNDAMFYCVTTTMAMIQNCDLGLPPVSLCVQHTCNAVDDDD